MSNLQTALINFQNTDILTAQNEQGKIFVALKPLIVGMGLDWKSQYAKIKNDSRFNCGDNTMVGLDGKNREMVTLDLDHLPAFLYSINPNRVKKELRDKIIAFQTETFSVINEYWRSRRKDPEITIVNTTDQERLNTLEKQLYMVKRENTELRRAVNRVTYNQKHLKTYEIDAELYLFGVMPELHRRIEELGNRISTELGTVGKSYTDELGSMLKYFTKKPMQGGNFVWLGDTCFPHAMIRR